jgi:hypothetical protein
LVVALASPQAPSKRHSTSSTPKKRLWHSHPTEWGKARTGFQVRVADYFEMIVICLSPK